LIDAKEKYIQTASTLMQGCNIEVEKTIEKGIK